MKLLIKLPSRQRPDVLLHAAKLYADLCADPSNTRMLISLDRDDRSLGNARREQLLKLRIPVDIKMGIRTTKVGAINRDLPGEHPWDVLLVASDDQWPVVPGYDARIRQDMQLHFPRLDGGLWYSDGQQDRICTQCIFGRAWYDRVGYVYNWSYASYRCDDEYTITALRAGKLVKQPICLIKHEHQYFNGKVPLDALYRFNQLPKQNDEFVFQHRQQQGFPK